MKSAQNGIFKAVQLAERNSKATLIANMAANPQGEFRDLLILPVSDYGWKYASKKLPVYLALRSASVKLARLNEVFSEYAGLLSNLAGNGITDSSTFEQMADRLNENATKLASDSGVAPGGNAIPMFSTAATTEFERFINSKRKDDLRAAILTNQETVNTYSKRCLSLVHTIRGILQSYYNQRFNDLLKQWMTNRVGRGSAADTRRASIVNDALELNDSLTASLQMLKQVDQAISAIPGAHSDLAKSLEGQEGLLASTRQLVTSAQNLRSLYQEVKSSEGSDQ